MAILYALNSTYFAYFTMVHIKINKTACISYKFKLDFQLQLYFCLQLK